MNFHNSLVPADSYPTTCSSPSFCPYGVVFSGCSSTLVLTRSYVANHRVKWLLRTLSIVAANGKTERDT
jgi:hypothetical protein